MAEILAARTTTEWLERFDKAQVPCAPVLTRDGADHTGGVDLVTSWAR